MVALDAGRGNVVGGWRGVEVLEVARGGRGGDASQDGQAEGAADLLGGVEDARGQTGFMVRHTRGCGDSHADKGRAHTQAPVSTMPGATFTPERAVDRYMRQPEEAAGHESAARRPGWVCSRCFGSSAALWWLRDRR